MMACQIQKPHPCRIEGDKDGALFVLTSIVAYF